MRKIWLIISIILAVGLVTTTIGCDNNKDIGENVEVVFDARGGTFPSGVSLRRVEIAKTGTVETPPEVTLAGHTFIEWNTSQIGTGNTFAANIGFETDTTYFAIWRDDAFAAAPQIWDFRNINPVSPPTEAFVNKYDLTGAIFDAIKDAKSGSKLRFYFEAGRETDRDFSTVASIGTATVSTDSDIIVLKTGEGTGTEYFVDTEVDWALLTLSTDVNDITNKLTVFVPSGNEDKLLEIRLYEPIGDRTAPARPSAPPVPTGAVLTAVNAADPLPLGATQIATLNFLRGYFFDVSAGRGDVSGDEFAKITEAIAALESKTDRGLMLRVFLMNLNQNDRLSWGCGAINGVGVLNGADGRAESATNGFRANNIGHVTFIDIIGNRTSLNFNPYNDHVVALIQLYEIDFVPVIAGDSVTILVNDEPVEVEIRGQGGNVTMLLDGSGYEFAGTTGHRAKYAWFRLDLGNRRLSEFKEISFNVRVIDGSENRRYGLMAQSSAYSGGLPTHQTTNNSGAGLLAAYQVTAPMDSSINPTAAAQLVTLPILKNYASTLDGSGVVFLSIYEHTAAAAIIRITDIELIGFAEGECPNCGQAPTFPCTCNDAITAAKAAIEGATFATTQFEVGTLIRDARNEAIAQVNALSLDGVEAEVIGTLLGYLPPVRGTPAVPAGVNGRYTFTVTLSRGLGNTVITEAVTMNITASVADECTFCGPISCTCTVDIETVRTAIQNASPYTATQTSAGTLTAARAQALSRITAVGLNNVIPTIVDGTFTAATAGNISNPTGTNGSFTFTVNLNRGSVAQQTTTTLTLTITATEYSPCFWCSQDPCTCTGKIFDMRNDAAMNALVRTNGGNISTTAHTYLQSNNGNDGFITITGTPNATITLTGRNGVGQAVRIKMGALNTIAKEGYSYRIEYAGTLGINNAVPRLRMEGGTLPAGGNTLDGTAVPTGTTFSLSVTFTREQIAANSANTLSLSAIDAIASSTGTANITYTEIRIIEIAP